MSDVLRLPLIHTAARCGPVPALRKCRGRHLLGCVLAAASSMLGGCSMSFPMGSLNPAAEDVTGSSSPVPFGRMLDAEDRRREKAALATALDPQGDGATVHWENATSGSKGAITAIGRAYPADGRICRGFLGDLKRDDLQRSVQGTACTAAAGEWVVRDAKHFDKAQSPVSPAVARGDAGALKG